MVNGIELFRDHFSDYKDQYTIIGGFACDLLMTDAGLNFRKTVDIDMVIIVEALTTEFAEAFWKFELFSRPQNHVTLQPDSHLMPLHIDDEVSSLSAILLNDDYYHFLLGGRVETNGISILDAEHIIPLKMKAWLDLKSKKEQGNHVDSRDLRKHRLDVFRLFPLIRAEEKVHVPVSVLADIREFIGQMRKTDIRLSDIGISRSKDSILDIYDEMYIV